MDLLFREVKELPCAAAVVCSVPEESFSFIVLCALKGGEGDFLTKCNEISKLG